MRKHAYLVMVHNNYKVLEKTLLLLDAPYNEFYIHVDEKIKNFPQAHFETLLQYSKVHVYSEVNVNWAGFSQVRCELFLLEKAVTGDYSFYHLLSGADMPIKRKDVIYNFFEQHRENLFIDYEEQNLRRHYKEIRNRLSKFHIIQEFRKRSKNKVIQGALTVLAKMLLGVQILCGVDRMKNEEIYYGSQWFSIPHDFAVYLVEQRKYIEQKFCYTQCPDEHVIQIMTMASKFRERLYCDEKNQYSNMRYIEWGSDKSAHPVIFQEKDIDRLLSSKMCFARKFDERTNYDAVEKLYARLKGTRYE